MLYAGLVISVCMQDWLAGLGERRPESYLVAHDLRSGRVRWKTPRTTKADAEECDSYTTPLLLKTNAGPQLVVMGGNQLDAYNPADGSQLWFLPGLIGGRTVTGPTAGRGLVYATIGMRGDTLAVRPGSGELNRRAIVWKNDQGTPDSCSPVLLDRWLYTVSDDGIARCFDAESGALQWKERLPGGYKASPLAADGRIYFLNTEGLCTVVSATSRFDKLTENAIDGETLASPAVSGGRIFLRASHSLYCIGP